MAALTDRSARDLIVKSRTGDPQALADLVPLVYEELRRVARSHLRRERADHTLQSTALIHEAYLRLSGGDSGKIRDRWHFVALASRVMRQVLVDHARARIAAKRQGGIRITLSDAIGASDQQQADVLAIDEALNRLSLLDQQQSKIVELRFFGGLSIEETSETLSISPATVKREWTAARAWLRRELDQAGPP